MRQLIVVELEIYGDSTLTDETIMAIKQLRGVSAVDENPEKNTLYDAAKCRILSALQNALYELEKEKTS